MKIKSLTRIMRRVDGKTVTTEPGIVEVDNKLGVKMLRDGLAEPVEEPVKVAHVGPPEWMLEAVSAPVARKLMEAGFVSREDFDGMAADDLKALDGVGAKSAQALLDHLGFAD